MEFIKKYKWAIGAILVLVSAIAGYLLLGRSNNPAPTSEENETAVAFLGDLSESASASGQVTASLEATLSVSSPGIVAALLADAGDTVVEGDMLIQLETAALERDVASAQQDLLIAEAELAKLISGPDVQDLAAAQATVASARAKLSDLLEGPSVEQIASSQAAVDAARAGIWSASGNVVSVNEVSEADILAARKALEAALEEQQARHDAWVNLANCEVNATGTHNCTPKEDNDHMEAATEAVRVADADVAIKQAQLDELLNPDASSIASAQSGVASASAQYDAAVARHEALTAGSTVAEIAAAEAELASAEATLDQLLAGPKESELKIYETRVEQARTALEEARNALSDASVTAPFAGTVTAVHVAEGELASGVVAEILASDALEVILNVDEVDVGRLTVGQPAIITLETWPDVEVESVITSIAPRAVEGSSGTVTYDVHLDLNNTDLPILVGMTAGANLITANRENVLLVPNAVVTANREDGTYTVNLVTTGPDGRPATNPVEVTVGLRDSRNTQITSGLNEGDEVVVGELVAPVQNNFRGPPGGRNR